MMFGKNTGSDETWKRIPKGSVGVEIGVWKGETSSKFLQNAGHLHLVDPWSAVAYEDSDEFGDYKGYLDRYSRIVGSNNPKDFQKYYDGVAANVRNKFADSPVTIHRCISDVFFDHFQEQVDWVYVDALHSFEGCLNDLIRSSRIIKSGGSIFGDDYGNKPGVVQAVDQFVKNTELEFDNFYTTQYEIKIP